MDVNFRRGYVALGETNLEGERKESLLYSNGRSTSQIERWMAILGFWEWLMLRERDRDPRFAKFVYQFNRRIIAWIGKTVQRTVYCSPH